MTSSNDKAYAETLSHHVGPFMLTCRPLSCTLSLYVVLARRNTAPHVRAVPRRASWSEDRRSFRQ